MTPPGIPFKPISLITPRSVHGVVGDAVPSRHHLAPSAECLSVWQQQQQQAGLVVYLRAYRDPEIFFSPLYVNGGRPRAEVNKMSVGGAAPQKDEMSRVVKILSVLG